jgi:hypothetical protein
LAPDSSAIPTDGSCLLGRGRQMDYEFGGSRNSTPSCLLLKDTFFPQSLPADGRRRCRCRCPRCCAPMHAIPIRRSSGFLVQCDRIRAQLNSASCGSLSGRGGVFRGKFSRGLLSSSSAVFDVSFPPLFPSHFCSFQYTPFGFSSYWNW